MVRTFKWIYELGVKQERLRIARILEQELEQRRFYLGTAHDMLSDNSKSQMNKERKAKLARHADIVTGVNEVIMHIMEPGWEQTTTSSALFPDDGLSPKGAK